MTVVYPVTTNTVDTSAVPLARYAQIIGYTENQFFGVKNSADDNRRACRDIWTKPERDLVAKYLLEAQGEIEDVIGFPLKPRWYADEQHNWKNPVIAKHTNVIEIGVMTSANVALASAVDHTGDPAVIGPIATTLTDPEEIVVYHPGTTIEIYPSSIEIVGGNLTIEIPRARLVKLASQENPVDGWLYTDTGVGGPFEQTVDVVRVYNDPSVNAELVYKLCEPCDETTKTGCIYVEDYRLGIFYIAPAAYSSGSWVSSGWNCCLEPNFIRVNYKAGLVPFTYQAEDAIVRLAHAKMPHSPCLCDTGKQMWERDRVVPDALSLERAHCPFGTSDGAWMAYQFALSMRILRGGVL